MLRREGTFQYQLKLPGYSFEGPLDLLLQMIERHELSITEISLARIADEYVLHIEQLEEVSPGALADFLVIAARLLLIKSHALLPALPRPLAGNEAEPEDLAEQLVEQLRQYKQIKAAAEELRVRYEAGMRAYPSRRRGLSETQLRLVTAELKGGNGSRGLQGLTLADLVGLVRRRLTAQAVQQLKLPLPATSQHLKELVRSVKIEDKIALIEGRLQAPASAARLEFTSLFELHSTEPPAALEIIVTFMAVLELLRRKQVQVEQLELFGEIFIQPLPML